jgi:hypothetical protein
MVSTYSFLLEWGCGIVIAVTSIAHLPLILPYTIATLIAVGGEQKK